MGCCRIYTIAMFMLAGDDDEPEEEKEKLR
jgi:hypothetical protein